MDLKDQPVQVILVVYDLLPAGNLSKLAWTFGVGLYHSAIKIPAIGKEITFGGHPHPQLSGIFSLPVRDDGSPSMPGLRCLCEIDMGQVQTIPQSHSSKSAASSTRSFNSLLEDDESRRLIQLPPSIAKIDKPRSDSSHQSYPYPPTSVATNPNKHIGASTHHPYASSTNSSLDSNKSSSSLFSSLNQIETLTLILDRLTHSPDWYGTSYDLLKRNCNTFSDELCMLLTGKNAPNWLNRAASLGSAFPCLVPAEWIEPPIAPPEPNQSLDYEQTYDHQFTSRIPSPTSPMKVKPTTIS